VPSTIEAIGLPFKEAIGFLGAKANVTSEHWTDVWRTAHTRSFMVAGAATQAIVADFRAEVMRAIEQGTSLQDFRRGFDGIVAKHGWSHTGTPGWRARIIYETNLSTAYSAGRYAQMTEPGTLAVYPYWQYVHSGAQHPRQQHKTWDGLTLRADDAFWKTHYPPNGWRCGCRVRPVSARGMARQGRPGVDQAPPVVTRAWTNPRTGQVHQVPEGIDPGFDYSPGEAWTQAPELPGNAALRIPPLPAPPPIAASPAMAGPGRPAQPGGPEGGAGDPQAVARAALVQRLTRAWARPVPPDVRALPVAELERVVVQAERASARRGGGRA
jgi:hypothetical protein